MPAVSSVYDREHQTDKLLVSFYVLLRATKVSHRYKKLTHLYNFGYRQCEAVNGNM